MPEIIRIATRELPESGKGASSMAEVKSEVQRIEAGQEKVVSQMLVALRRRDEETSSNLRSTVFGEPVAAF